MSTAQPRAVSLLRQLIAIPSVNPAYDPESPGEVNLAPFIEAWAIALGLPVERQPVLGERSNVIVRLIAGEGLPTLVYESHMDTVSIEPGTRGGFEPTIEGDLLYGRGACDTKGSMAAMMTAIEELIPRRGELACNVDFLAAVDEETGGAGARAYATTTPGITGAVIGEPTSNRVVNRHKGVVRGSIVVTGKAAHTSIAHEGINAIDAAADVIAELRSVSQALGSSLESGSFTISLIEGGTGINIVPAECTIKYDCRIVPGERAADAIAQIDAALDLARQRRPAVSITRPDPHLVSPPLNSSLDAGVVRAAIVAAGRSGLASDPVMVPYGSDASRFNEEAGIDCVVFGPGSIDVAHGADEHVPIAELVAAADFYREIALAYGRQDA